MNKSYSIFLILTLLILGSCDVYNQDSFQQQYVLESYLVAGNPLPKVRLSTTLPADEKYTFEKAAVSGAQVEMRLLDDHGNISETYTYSEATPGIYLTTDKATVQPKRKYELYITIPSDQNHVLQAETIVPDTFRTLTTPPDSIVYQSADQLSLKSTRSYYPGRQNIFVFNVLAQDAKVENYTPFYKDITGDDAEKDIADYQNNQSNIVNEGNYEINDDGTITLRLPWIGFAFFGRNKIVTNAIDDNVYDFLRSQSVQTGGSTLSPGQIQNVIDHVDGGIGVFGSMATDTVSTYLKRPN